MPVNSKRSIIQINIENLPEFRKRVARTIFAAAELNEALKELNGTEIQLSTTGNCLCQEFSNPSGRSDDKNSTEFKTGDHVSFSIPAQEDEDSIDFSEGADRPAPYLVYTGTVSRAEHGLVWIDTATFGLIGVPLEYVEMINGGTERINPVRGREAIDTDIANKERGSKRSGSGRSYMIRAKFKCRVVTLVEAGASVEMHPVVSGSTENKEFYSHTPGGVLTLETVNKEAAKQFIPGQEYYIDITAVG